MRAARDDVSMLRRRVIIGLMGLVVLVIGTAVALVSAVRTPLTDDREILAYQTHQGLTFTVAAAMAALCLGVILTGVRRPPGQIVLVVLGITLISLSLIPPYHVRQEARRLAAHQDLVLSRHNSEMARVEDANQASGALSEGSNARALRLMLLDLDNGLDLATPIYLTTDQGYLAHMRLREQCHEDPDAYRHACQLASQQDSDTVARLPRVTHANAFLMMFSLRQLSFAN